LAAERFIIPQFHEQVGLIDSLRQLSHAGGYDLPPLTRTDDFVTAAALAANGDGIVLAPASLAKLGMEGLAFVDVTGVNYRHSTILAIRDDAPDLVRAALQRTDDGAVQPLDSIAAREAKSGVHWTTKD
jgi:DNA-binding transcriptional LysR family regulator